MEAAKFNFNGMKEAELRQWMEANAGRINDRATLRHGDGPLRGETPLYVAAGVTKSLPSVLWVLDERDADVNATTGEEMTALHWAGSIDILNALLSRGADPNRLNHIGYTTLMEQAYGRELGLLARLLEDPRVRNNIDVVATYGGTALHIVCESNYRQREHLVSSILRLLLQAGSNPALTNWQGQTALEYLREELFPKPAAIAVLEQVPDAEKASTLVKARRLAVSADSNATPPVLYARPGGVR